MGRKMMEKYQNMPVQVKASVWFLVCSFLQKGISVITTPIFTRLLSTAEYGQYNVFQSWMGIATIFVSMNLSAGVYTQGLVKYEEERAVFSSSLQGLTTILVAVWTVVYLLFQNFWNSFFSLTTVQMLCMLVMIWTSAAFGFWASEQRVLYRYKGLVFVTLVVSLAKPFLEILFVVHAHDKVTARILGMVLVELIGYIGLYIAQMWRGRKFYSAQFWKYALRFNLPLIPHYLSQTVLNSADRIMIKRMTGDSNAGIYSLAYSLALIMTLLNGALTQTINPWIYQKIKATQYDEIAPVAYISLIMIAGANLLLIAFAPEAVAVFAPKSYYEAIYVIPPVAMSAYFIYSYDLFAKFAFYFEKTQFIMTASVAAAFANIVLNYIFIGIFGYQAGGYTTLVCYSMYCIFHYMFMNKVCDQYCDGARPYDLKKLLGITLGFIFAGFLLLSTYDFAIARYGIILFTAVAAFVKRNQLLDKVRMITDIKKK